MNGRTAELYSKHGNTDVTELVVIDDTTQCEKSKRHNGERNVLLHMWSRSARIICTEDRVVENLHSAGHDSLERCAVAIQDKRSNMTPQ